MNESFASVKSLFSLDDMVLFKILMHLNVSDLVNLGRTCKRFGYLTQHHFEKQYSSVSWRKNNRYSITLGESSVIFRNIGKYIRSMNLTFWSDVEFCKILVAIANECCQLDSLKFDSIRMNSCQRQISKDPMVSLMFRKLKEFAAKGCCWTWWCPIEEFSDENDENLTLEQLSITDCYWAIDRVDKLKLKMFRALKELQLIECQNLVSSTVELQRCFENNSIVSLTLTNVGELGHINLFEPHLIHPLCSSIEHLTIDYHRPFDFNQLLKLTRLKTVRILSKQLSNIDELISNLNPEIEVVEVSNVFITASTLETFNSFQRLCRLSFEKCYNTIPTEFFTILPASLPNLQNLVYTYSVVTDRDIVHLLRSMPKLRYLSLVGCCTLSKHTYRKMVDILLEDVQRPKLRFIPPQLGSLNDLMAFANVGNVLF